MNKIDSFHTIAFDFDGVFTDNKVYINELGIETVRCDRLDSLGLDILREYLRMRKIAMDLFIISTEKSPVVLSRAKKLGIPCWSGVADKADFLMSHFNNDIAKCKGLVFVGNDVNDLKALEVAGFSYAPSDAHPAVLARVDRVMARKGGDGFVRSVVEDLLGGDLYKISKYFGS